jgi:hypothetical protein
MIATHILITLTYTVFVIYILATALITVVKGREECRNLFSTLAILFSEIVFTIVGPVIGFLRFDQFQPDIPFAKQHVLTIILLVISSSGAFWLARFTNKTANPLVRIIISVGLLQGIILCAFTTIHFLPFIPNGLMFPTIGFELLSPLVAFVLLFRAFYFYNKMELDLSELLPYREELGFIPIPLSIFQLPIFQRCFVYAVLLIPAVIAQVTLAYGCGQDIDALIKAFTHSHGFTFSNN